MGKWVPSGSKQKEEKQDILGAGVDLQAGLWTNASMDEVVVCSL